MYRLNLLDSETRRSLFRFSGWGFRTRTGRAAALLLLAAYGAFLLALHVSDLQLKRHESALRGLEPEIQSALALSADRESAEAKLDAWLRAADPGWDWVAVLGLVGGALPPDVQLTALSLVPGEQDAERPEQAEAAVVHLEGIAGSLPSLGFFVHGLQRLDCFSKTELQAARENKDGVLVFVITLKLAGDGHVGSTE